MEIRIFQIIIPLLVIIAIAKQVRDTLKGKAGFYESVLISIFWIGVAGVAIFPDFFSDLIAKVFGIKNSTNAIIFFAIGLLFYFQLQLYKMLRKQDQLLTEISRKEALKNVEKK
ncbi:MAG: hypothetical protein ACI85O_001459 [Saprospiraceae bacterium]|jgi:hypothetical protein